MFGTGPTVTALCCDRQSGDIYAFLVLADGDSPPDAVCAIARFDRDGTYACHVPVTGEYAVPNAMVYDRFTKRLYFVSEQWRGVLLGRIELELKGCEDEVITAATITEITSESIDEASIYNLHGSHNTSDIGRTGLVLSAFAPVAIDFNPRDRVLAVVCYDLSVAVYDPDDSSSSADDGSEGERILTIILSVGCEGSAPMRLLSHHLWSRQRDPGVLTIGIHATSNSRYMLVRLHGTYRTLYDMAPRLRPTEIELVEVELASQVTGLPHSQPTEFTGVAIIDSVHRDIGSTVKLLHCPMYAPLSPDRMVATDHDRGKVAVAMPMSGPSQWDVTRATMIIVLDTDTIGTATGIVLATTVCNTAIPPRIDGEHSGNFRGFAYDAMGNLVLVGSTCDVTTASVPNPEERIMTIRLPPQPAS